MTCPSCKGVGFVFVDGWYPGTPCGECDTLGEVQPPPLNPEPLPEPTCEGCLDASKDHDFSLQCATLPF